ncbi:MAG: restriction endonuclease [Bryobacterales bacterium]|nr:restriction endonuclease [Bryobacterales bacterium]
MIADNAYQYPPDLLNLMVDGIAALVRSKEAVLDFFRGAGVPNELLTPWLVRVKADRDNVRKTDITRDVLRTVNEMGDNGLALRREIIKRVVEWEDFSSCYPDKQLVAQGLVANIRRVVNVKDSFTQMNLARERERAAQQQRYEAEAVRRQQEEVSRDAIKRDLYALFGNANAHKRGKALEGILNRFFEHSGLLVKEAFTLSGNPGQGVVEQIDGAIQFEGEIYLVEMKWWNDPIGSGEVNSHLSRLMTRAEARGMFVSASGFTTAAIESVRSFLSHRLCVLCELEEIVKRLESGGSFSDLMARKVQAAIMQKQPLFKC